MLAISADTLLGEPAPEIAPGGQSYNLQPLRAVLLDASFDDPPDIPARPVPVLGEVNGAVDQDLGGVHPRYLAPYIRPGLCRRLRPACT